MDPRRLFRKPAIKVAREDIVLLVFASLMICGTFFQFVSYAAPGWTIFKYTNQLNASWYYFHEKLLEGHTYHWGMWFYRVCDTSDVCTAKSYHQEYYSFKNDPKEKTGLKWTHGNMYEYTIMEQMRALISFACSLGSCIFAVLYMKLRKHTNFLSFMAVVLTVISETLAFQLIVEYGHNERWSSTYQRQYYQHLHQVPYSIILCAFGLVLRIPASVYFMVHINKALH